MLRCIAFCERTIAIFMEIKNTHSLLLDFFLFIELSVKEIKVQILAIKIKVQYFYECMTYEDLYCSIVYIHQKLEMNMTNGRI